jgi:hypothetical protein
VQPPQLLLQLQSNFFCLASSFSCNANLFACLPAFLQFSNTTQTLGALMLALAKDT